MRDIRSIFLGTIIATMAISSAAFAEGSDVYVGGNIGVGSPNINMPNGEDKKSSAVGGVVLGYKFNPYVAIEGQYTGAGKVTDKTNGSAKVDAASLTMLGILPLNDQFNLYGKLGIATTKTTVSSLKSLNDATRVGVTYGLGAEYELNHSLGMRLGWDHYNASVQEASGHEKNVGDEVVSVGAIYHF